MNTLRHLIKDERAHWQATLADGSVHNSVTVVRAFPILAPDEAISVIDIEGHELCWIEQVSDSTTGCVRRWFWPCKPANSCRKF